MNTEHKEMISELLDYEAELSNTELGFLNTVKDYSELTESTILKVEKLYDRVFGDQTPDTYEVFSDYEN
jgi:hypothetical protein